MSIQVPPEDLAETLRGFGGAYLVTVGGDGRAHIVAVAPVLGEAGLRLGSAGRTTRRNLEGNSVVSLVWPPLEPGGHSLIADGTVSLGDDDLIVRLTRAVLHRPAPAVPAAPGPGEADGGCEADCHEVRSELTMPPGVT
jgi:hypothetical protein